MTYNCQIGKCFKHTRRFSTWDDLIDHMLNDHRYDLVDNKLIHERNNPRRQAHKMACMEDGCKSN